MWSCGYVAARCCLLETDGSEARLRILQVVLSGYFGSLGLEYSQEYPILTHPHFHLLICFTFPRSLFPGCPSRTDPLGTS